MLKTMHLLLIILGLLGVCVAASDRHKLQKQVGQHVTHKKILDGVNPKTVAISGTTGSLPLCPDPDLGCVDGVSIEQCENGVCDASEEYRLATCYLEECADPGPVPRCSCPHKPPVISTTPDILPPCGDPILGCVDGVYTEACQNGVCNNSALNMLTQCYLRACSDPGPVPQCSCPNMFP